MTEAADALRAMLRNQEAAYERERSQTAERDAALTAVGRFRVVGALQMDRARLASPARLCCGFRSLQALAHRSLPYRDSSPLCLDTP